MKPDYAWWIEGLEEYMECAGQPDEQPGIDNYNRCRRQLLDWLRERVKADAERVEQDYGHFLAYSGLDHSPVLRYAYFHGADIGLDRP